MRLALRRHPDSLGAAATKLDVEAAASRPGSLLLSYIVTGKIDDLRLPPVTAPTRADELWRHTCFEAFIRVPPGDAYYEFNFSPSTQWAIYRFDHYRAGMCVAREIATPRIKIQSSPGLYTLQAAVELDPALPLSRLGLSAVIEEAGGNKSYWALAHPAGKPDFHHSDCFTHEFFPA